jgi:DNA-binding MurR/RpiR family transcriptional regulator
MKNTVQAGDVATSTPFAETKVGGSLLEFLRTGTGSHRQVADYILRNPVRASSTNIEELAAQTGVSPATISRFARGLGFDGFADMRMSIADALVTVMAPVAKLRKSMAETRGVPSAAGSLHAVSKQLGLLDADGISRQCAHLAVRIAKARSVHVMGFGMSAHLAGLAVLGLQPYHPAVSAVVEFGGTEVAAGRLMAIGKPDLVLAITFPRYSSDVVSLARYARARDAGLVALTDSIASPLFAIADETVIAPADHAVLSSSVVAAVAIIETLIAAFMLSDPKNVDNADRLTEAIAGYLHSGGR